MVGTGPMVEKVPWSETEVSKSEANRKQVRRPSAWSHTVKDTNSRYKRER